MPNYRRVYVDGGCWFFTVNLANRRSRLLTEHIGALREAVAKVRRRLPFEIDAWVVLPEHMHAVWSLPDGDSDFSTRWRLIKTFFSRSLPATEWRSDVHNARCERGIWQRRYWEHLIRDERDYAYRLLLVQSREARPCRQRRGLAVLVIPPRQSRQPASGRFLEFRKGACRERPTRSRVGLWRAGAVAAVGRIRAKPVIRRCRSPNSGMDRRITASPNPPYASYAS